MGVGSQRHVPAPLTPGKSPGTYYTEGSEGVRHGLDGCDKYIWENTILVIYSIAILCCSWKNS
jgi:hypothetical protein